MSEEDVIKRRLMFDGDGTGEDRRLNVLIKLVAKWVNTNEETEDECKISYDKISAHLALVENARRRSDLVHKQTELQHKNYEELLNEMGDNIKKIKEDILKQKVELEKAKIIKQNRIQYDLLAKAIEKEPPRTLTNINLAIVQDELADLAGEKKDLQYQLNTRKKQFKVLSTSAESLVQLLIADENYQDLKDDQSSDDNSLQDLVEVKSEHSDAMSE